MLFARIIEAFKAPEAPADIEKRRRALVSRVVAARSHGNIRLQMGKFYTKEDVNERYEQIKSKRFSEA